MTMPGELAPAKEVDISYSNGADNLEKSIEKYSNEELPSKNREWSNDKDKAFSNDLAVCIE